MVEKQHIYCWYDSLDLDMKLGNQGENCIGIKAPLNTVFSFFSDWGDYI